MLAKIDIILLIKTLQKISASILLLLSKTAKELDKNIIFLVEVIDIAINVSIFKTKLCAKSLPGFDKNCKDAQIKIKKLKRIWKKEGTKNS